MDDNPVTAATPAEVLFRKRVQEAGRRWEIEAIDERLYHGLRDESRLRNGLSRNTNATGFEYIQAGGFTKPLWKNPVEPHTAPSPAAGVDHAPDYQHGNVAPATQPNEAFLDEPLEEASDFLPREEAQPSNFVPVTLDELLAEEEGDIWFDSPRHLSEESVVESGGPTPAEAVDDTQWSMLDNPGNATDDFVPPPFDEDPQTVFRASIAELDALMADLDRDDFDFPREQSPVLFETEPPEIEVPSSWAGQNKPPQSPAFNAGALQTPTELIEAEQWLQELENQPRESASIHIVPTQDETPEEPVQAVAQMPDEEPLALIREATTTTEAPVAPVQEIETTPPDFLDSAIEPAPARARKPRATKRARSHRPLRRVVVWFFSTAALCVWGMAVYYLGVFVIAPSVPPERAFSAAQAMVSSGQYAKASRAFEQFAAEFPQHPANGEARFQTANCLLLASGGLEDEEKNLYLALEKLTAFISENPGHVRIPRARTLLGQTCFKLKDFTRATEILGDPALPAEDTEGAASILRTLARANVATGQYAAAESAYLKLTALPGNNWVAVDREELGDLFSIRANRAKGDERRQLLRAASEQLNMAIQVSGTDPESRDRLQLKCNHLLTELGGLPK